MKTLKVIYSRSHTIGGIFIRAAQWWAQWTHCGVVTPDGTVLEAQFLKGVIETPYDKFVSRCTAFEVVEVPCPDPEAAIAWARSKLGEGYDYGAIIQFILREPLEGKKRKHCVELVESALTAGGNNRFRIEPYRLTPQQSYIARN